MKRCTACGHAFDGNDWRCPACGHRPAVDGGYPSFAPDLAAANEGFDARSFPLLARLEEDNFWFRARNRLIAWAARRYVPHPSRILEVGCGTGFVLRRLRQEFPEAELWGSEIHSAALPFVRERLGAAAELVQLDARDIPFVEHFDLIGAFDVIEHIEEDETVLRQVFAALRPGGGLVATVPQHTFLWSAADDFAHHKRRYRPGELRRKAMACGFRVLCDTSFVSLLMPAMMASRWLRRDPTDYDPEAEFHLLPLLNRSFEGVMAVERALIVAGLRLPAGGSRLLVAQRP